MQFPTPAGTWSGLCLRSHAEVWLEMTCSGHLPPHRWDTPCAPLCGPLVLISRPPSQSKEGLVQGHVCLGTQALCLLPPPPPPPPLHKLRRRLWAEHPARVFSECGMGPAIGKYTVCLGKTQHTGRTVSETGQHVAPPTLIRSRVRASRSSEEMNVGQAR